ncbi:uncharacterized protein BO66DRAFT_413745 [Aspergillus aculeatinus CBS 121060]|uniref:Uncharacterized protein n=1 Tax=Aspergillus aculeatinus CBS 121060 TaxID=1448322 RepID=A0ACD1H156_9EURO|nr:hypothetical protein BO66DRAFT_413745 [Aspergillus aculeatinus CBS 121060]RAH67161.1 hypothetical protein BO66DRAFT_413745 [Aspergillus aculeatinus CBS 121060]
MWLSLADWRCSTAAHDETLFRFTRGRFLTDEAYELAKRHIRFNVDELARLAVQAAEAANKGPRTCIAIEKLADGMHSKAIRFTMDNGFQAVGKVPTPNAGLPRLTTASEVATMDFMRNVLGTPVPRVLSWSSSADNPVAAEYILMENARGVPLSSLWDKLGVRVKFKVLEKVAAYQQRWSQVRFTQYGSLYYRGDLDRSSSSPGLRYTDKDGNYAVDERFAVGPSVSRQNVDDGRADLGFDRGPWDTVDAYERATGEREAYCTRSMEQLPRSPIAIHYSGTYQPSRETKLFAIESFLKVVDLLLPGDEDISASCIWHDDLHVENVFVNPEDPSEIYAFIDWQSTELAPLYHHTIEPYILDYHGPPFEGLLDRPKLADVKALFQDEHDQAAATRKAETLFTSMSLLALYRYLLHKTMPRLFKALEFRQTDCFDLLLFARNLLVDGEATYLGPLAKQQEENWAGVSRILGTGTKAPLTFSDDVLQKIKCDGAGASAAMALMGDVQRMIGSQYFQARGLVSHAQFAELERILPKARDDFVRAHARNAKEERELTRAWPFDIPGSRCDYLGLERTRA